MKSGGLQYIGSQGVGQDWVPLPQPNQKYCSTNQQSQSLVNVWLSHQVFDVVWEHSRQIDTSVYYVFNWIYNEKMKNNKY